MGHGSKGSFVDMDSAIDNCHSDLSKGDIEMWALGILADIENTVL